MTRFRSLVFAAAIAAAGLPAFAQSAAPQAAQPSGTSTATPADTSADKSPGTTPGAEAVPDTGMKKTVGAPRARHRLHHVHAHNAVQAAPPAASR